MMIFYPGRWRTILHGWMTRWSDIVAMLIWLLVHDGLNIANEASDLAGPKTHNTAIHVLINNIPDNSTHSIEPALFQLGMLQLALWLKKEEVLSVSLLMVGTWWTSVTTCLFDEVFSISDGKSSDCVHIESSCESVTESRQSLWMISKFHNYF